MTNPTNGDSFVGMTFRQTDTYHEGFEMGSSATWAEIIYAAHKRNKALGQTIFNRMTRRVLDTRDDAMLYELCDDNSRIVYVESLRKFMLPKWKRG